MSTNSYVYFSSVVSRPNRKTQGIGGDEHSAVSSTDWVGKCPRSICEQCGCGQNRNAERGQVDMSRACTHNHKVFENSPTFTTCALTSQINNPSFLLTGQFRSTRQKKANSSFNQFFPCNCICGVSRYLFIIL